MVNRLAAATSPYLLQHKDNPVHWQEWGPEAFAEAKRLDRPVLLSVGYAACHWCHVMAHESFEDDETAAQQNAGFVNVKVDREERPDVDAVYMAATQALTGQGGWPMTVFLTPEGKPFYAGTYFPPEPRHGLPSFRQLLTAISQTWRERRGDVVDAGDKISAALAERPQLSGAQPPDARLLDAAVQALAGAEDTVRGGFGGAPKFPPSMVCEFLLRQAATGAPTAATARELAGRTLAAMARSGMYDQLGGGFARYSVDAAWVVPHFEKMLYDNAQLARVYLHWWRLTGDPTGARIAQETCAWMLRDLGTPEGGLASSLDADTQVTGPDGASHGVEGLTYVWTPQQLTQVLGADDGVWAADLLAVTPDGTFEHGSSTLQLTRDVWATPGQAQRWHAARALLMRSRQERPQPGRDDKVVAAWNGLAIAALAETGALLGQPHLVTAAERIAGLLLDLHLVEGRLRRASRDGVAGQHGGVLEDYGDVAEGLLALHCVTGSARWLAAAGELLDVVLEEFVDGQGVHDTPASVVDAALAAVQRPADPTDNATPSGASAAAGALLSYAALTGSARHRQAAEFALGAAGAGGERAPQAFGWGLAVAVARLDGPREVAIAGPDHDPARDRLHQVALAAPAPGLVISVGDTDAPGVPLLADRPVREGQPTAFVCRGFSCDLPTADPDRLAAQLR
jgi:uncharacterized protein